MSAVKTLRAPRKTAAASAALPVVAPAAAAAAIAALAAATKLPVSAKAPRATTARKTAPRAAAKALPKALAPAKTAPRALVATVAPLLAKPKNKLVRDSFTIPKAEYIVLENLKLRAANLKRPTKKSEVLRAGVAVLHAMGDKAFLTALNAVPSLKTGRPKSVDSVASPTANPSKSR